MKKTVLREYAKLIARKGANVQKGQEVVISAELDCPEFVKYTVEECYKAGASKVTVQFSYQPLTKVNVKYQKPKTLGRVEKWEEERLSHRLDTLPATIYLVSEDPDGLKGMDQKKYSAAIQSRMKVIKPYRDKMDNHYQWCIAAVPGEMWAKKIFPGVRTAKAVEMLWDAILSCSRAYGDPINNWEEHNAELRDHYTKLNNMQLKTLHYKASNGTDLTVGLRELGEFAGGEETTLEGVKFNPNIPSEECFVSPKKGEAEGIVYSTKPLSYNGELIDEFWIRFKDGKAVECGAKQNEELLKELINMDEGAAYLGECALVGFDSPINESGLLFYNTLFDENACCHLALGRGFPETTKDFEKYTLKELHEMGVNDSIIHEDFMIGTADLEITGTSFDGKEYQIFKNGKWAF
ncbi:MAG: aminopeptidase [Clostridia bacterium]|nr:aminopeptidase [Clostridia bacterium]